MSYKDFPWFKDQAIKSIINVEEQSPGHFYWPESVGWVACFSQPNNRRHQRWVSSRQLNLRTLKFVLILNHIITTEGSRLPPENNGVLKITITRNQKLAVILGLGLIQLSPICQSTATQQAVRRLEGRLEGLSSNLRKKSNLLGSWISGYQG